MEDAFLTLLKWCLLALVYLFFIQVMRATWRGSTANVSVAPVSKGSRFRREKSQVARAKANKLVIIEPPTLTGQEHVVQGEMTIGRAAGCQITIEDNFISQLHVRVSANERGLVIEDLGSTNGSYLNRQRLTTPIVGQVGDQLQMGGIVMELRA